MRARNIKPDFFTDEKLIKLTFSERLFFIGLWCLADSEGFFEIKPHEMKLKIFPEQKVDLIKMLKSLEKAKVVKLYSQHGFLPNFIKHQRPHPKEKKSIVNKEIREHLEKLNGEPCNYPADPSDIMNVECGMLNVERGKMNVECGMLNDAFVKFWDAYPKKIGKPNALIKFKTKYKASKQNGLFIKKILLAIELHKKSEQWKNPKYIPHPATWLNQERYNDDIYQEMSVLEKNMHVAKEAIDEYENKKAEK
jgi:hypothetical protein